MTHSLHGVQWVEGGSEGNGHKGDVTRCDLSVIRQVQT